MRAGFSCFLFFCLSPVLLATLPPVCSSQDTIRIDTSAYIPNDHDYNLIIASFYAYPSEVLRLLNLGADPNSRTYDGITPLMYAVQNGDLETTKILVLNGANVNHKPWDGVSPIIAASRYNFVEIVDFLIRNGAEVNDRDNEGASPLLYAAGYYYYELCELLLINKANPEINDNGGTTPIMAAAYGGNPDVIDLLIRYDANINRADSEGTTALMIAAQNGDTAMIRIVSGLGADLNLLNKQDYSALDIAVITGHADATEQLIMLGADSDRGGTKNPYSLAMQYGHPALARKLIELGIKPRRLPSFSQIFIFTGINTSFNDLMGGGELGLRDPVYKFNIVAGYQVRLFAKRILKETGDDTYLQLWENRSLAYLGLTKEFILIGQPGNREFGLTAGLLGGYTFGRNYRGSENHPDELWKAIPAAGLFWGGERFRMDFSYHYLNLDTHKISPHRFMIGLKYRFRFKNLRVTEKIISWY